MKISVYRFKSNEDATLSGIFIDGKFECFGLEDEYRECKIACETRIPAGEYSVGIKSYGRFDDRYRKKFHDFHEGMLHVLGVPNFTDILIHIGNTDEDTAGCLLVGQNSNISGELTVTSSTNAYKHFYKKVVDAAVFNELMIEYVDMDL